MRYNLSILNNSNYLNGLFSTVEKAWFDLSARTCKSTSSTVKQLFVEDVFYE